MIKYFIRVLKDLIKQWVLSLVATIGIMSGIVQLFPNLDKMKYGNLKFVGIGLVVFPIVSVIIYLITFKKYDYLSENVVPHDIDEPSDIKVQFPCNDTMYKGANSLANEAFGKAGLSSDIIESWRTKNPYVLSCLTDKGKFVGYFDILPLIPEFGETFINGNVGEKKIRGEHIFSIEEMSKCEHIYFSGIAVKDAGTGRGLRRGCVMLRAALEYIENFYDLSTPKMIYTIPVSDCGRKIADKLGFELQQDGFLRKDKLDLFSRSIDKNSLKLLKDNLGRLERFYDFTCYKKFLADLN